MALPVVSNSLNRTTTHCFLTKRPLFLRLRLLVDKRIIVLITPHEVLRCGVAADVAVDARRVDVIRTKNVLFYLVVLVRHANLGSGMRHVLRIYQPVKLFFR